MHGEIVDVIHSLSLYQRKKMQSQIFFRIFDHTLCDRWWDGMTRYEQNSRLFPQKRGTKHRMTATIPCKSECKTKSMNTLFYDSFVFYSTFGSVRGEVLSCDQAQRTEFVVRVASCDTYSYPIAVFTLADIHLESYTRMHVRSCLFCFHFILKFIFNFSSQRVPSFCSVLFGTYLLLFLSVSRLNLRLRSAPMDKRH